MVALAVGSVGCVIYDLDVLDSVPPSGSSGDGGQPSGGSGGAGGRGYASSGTGTTGSVSTSVDSSSSSSSTVAATSTSATGSSAATTTAGAGGAGSSATVGSGGQAGRLSDDRDAGGAAGSATSDAGSTCTPSSSAQDYCVAVPRLGAPAVIDGELDCGPVLKKITPVGWSGGSTSIDVTTSYAIAWRPEGLYFYILVQDASLVPADPDDLVWKGDAAEVYVDNDGRYASAPRYDAHGTRQIVIAAPSSSVSSAARAQVFSFGNDGFPKTWTSSDFRAYVKPGGYAVEAIVRAQDIGLASWSLAAGQSVGFDISVNVSFANPKTVGSEGHRVGQYFLHIDPASGADPPYWNSRGFCNPVLAAP